MNRHSLHFACYSGKLASRRTYARSAIFSGVPNKFSRYFVHGIPGARATTSWTAARASFCLPSFDNTAANTANVMVRETLWLAGERRQTEANQTFKSLICNYCIPARMSCYPLGGEKPTMGDASAITSMMSFGVTIHQ